MAFFNFSTSDYAVLAVREHATSGDPGDYVETPLLAPGGTFQEDFSTLLGAACPGSLDLQIRVYRRINRDEPIGLDPGEMVEEMPIVAGELLDVPACDVEKLETYTIAHWDGDTGFGRVKIAQCTAIDEALTASNRFGNDEGVWEIVGVDPALDVVPAHHAAVSPIAGRVVLANGQGVAGIGVLVRSRFRLRLDCGNADNPDDAGYSDPIDFTITDDDGRFSIPRPPGTYRLEFFSDDYAFRPGEMNIETPLDDIRVLVEPL